jgi:glyoxalase family protein
VLSRFPSSLGGAGSVRLDGLHHITAITADARQNVEFYESVLGLRLGGDSASPRDSELRELSYGSVPGRGLVFVVYPGGIAGRSGAGMVERIAWRVPSPAALGFWAGVLRAVGVEAELDLTGSLRFRDPEGLGHELVVDRNGDGATMTCTGVVPHRYAIRGFAGVRAYARVGSATVRLMQDVLGAQRRETGRFELAGASGADWIGFARPPAVFSRRGAGTVHHVAWTARPCQLPRWLVRLDEAGIPNSGLVRREHRRCLFFVGPDGLLLDLVSEPSGATSPLHLCQSAETPSGPRANVVP